MIRILTIWPNSDRSVPLEGSLRIEKIFSRPQYNAISYYWGNANELESVLIRGSDKGLPTASFKVPVTRCLAEALRQFRATATEAKEPLLVWTDALCVNQQDAGERSHQVDIMSSIFALATSVWIWLGESDELVEQGLIALVSICARYRLPGSDVCGLVLMGHESRHVSAGGSTAGLQDTAAVTRQLAAIDALPYWRRGWAFQESAQHSKYLHYGKLKIEVTTWIYLMRSCSEWYTLTNTPIYKGVLL